MTIDINNFISLKGNINQGVKEALRDLNKNFIVTMLDSDELQPSEDNFYKPRDIDKMKDSIEAFGIQQNLIVMKKNDKYEILAGERRYRGNKMLLDEDKEEFRLLPCRILPKISDTLKNIIIILTNSEARVKTSWEITEEVARLKILYENYKKENPNFKGRVREATAQDLDMSPAQVGRHEKIHKDLIEGLKEEYKDENINFTVAQAAASLPEAEQEEALQKYQETGTLTTTDINNLKESKQPMVNEFGIYKKEFVESIKIEIPKKLGEITIYIAYDNGTYYVGENYCFCNPYRGGGDYPSKNDEGYRTKEAAIKARLMRISKSEREEIREAIIRAGYLTKEDIQPEESVKSYSEMTPCEQCRAANSWCKELHCCKTCEEHCNTRQICRIDEPAEKRQAEIDEYNKQTQKWRESKQQPADQQLTVETIMEHSLLKIEAAKFTMNLLIKNIERCNKVKEIEENEGNKESAQLESMKAEYLNEVLERVKKDLFDMTGSDMFKE